MLKARNILIFLVCLSAVFAGISAANIAPRPHVNQGLYDQRLPRQLVMVGDANMVVFYNQADDGEWYWWSIRASNDMVMDCNYIWPIANGEPNSVLITPGGAEPQLRWGQVDANLIIIDDDNDVNIALPVKTPWNVIFVDANGFPITDDPNHFTYYQPSGYFGLGTDYITGQTYANNYIQVYTLLDFEPTLFNTTVGMGLDDTTTGPNNLRIAHYAGKDLTTGTRNTLGGKDNGMSLNFNVDNSFWGYQTGKNIKSIGTVERDEAYIISDSDNLYWFDPDWNYLGWSGSPGIGITTSITQTADGTKTIVGASTYVVVYDVDLTPDQTFYVPDAGSFSHVIQCVRLNSDESVLYVDTLWKLYAFDTSNGDELWNKDMVYANVFCLDGDDNIYMYRGTGSWTISKYDSDGNYVTGVNSILGARSLAYDSVNNVVVAAGITPYAYNVCVLNPANLAKLYTYADTANAGGVIVHNGYYYVCKGAGDDGYNVLKLDSELNVIAHATGGSTAIMVDWDGNIAVSNISALGSTVYRYDTDLTLVDTTDFVGGTYLYRAEIAKIRYSSSAEGNRNTAIGSQALAGASAGAEPNEASAGGYKNMFNVSSGDLSTGWGAWGLYSLTTGSRNVALGPYAAYWLTTEDDKYIVDSRKRANAADEIVSSILYGHMADDANDQWLNINVGELNLDFARLDVNDVNVAGDLTFTGLTASRLVSTDANKTLVSVSDLTSWIAATADETTVADDGDGTVTIGIADPLIVGKGGTGAATLTDGGILLGSGTGAVTPMAVLADGEFIVGDGTTDPVAESGNTARTTLGLGTGDSPTFAGLTVTNNCILASNSAVFQPNADSTTFFQVLDADGGTPVLNVDSTNERVGIGQATPTASLHLSSGGITIDSTIATGLDMSGGTFATAVQNWPATPVINVAGNRVIKFDATNYNMFLGTQAFNNADGQYNIGIGYQAGYNNDTTGAGDEGDKNIYIGYMAGYGNTPDTKNTGATNVGVGYQTLRDCTSGSRNVALGYQGLASLTTGVENFAVGSYSLTLLTTGRENLAIGINALRNSTASYNVAIGGAAGYLNVDGVQNLYFGRSAGYSNVSGSYNICIGTAAGYGSTGNSYSSDILIGSDVGLVLTTGSYLTVIGREAGKALTSGGYNTLIGERTGFNISTTMSNVMVGGRAGYQTIGSRNTHIGYSAGYTQAAVDDVIVIGYKAGYRNVTSNRLIIDNQDRGSAALELTNSLIYGVFNATPASQSLRINGEILGSDGAKIGDVATNYALIGATGDLSFAGSAGFYPRVLNQADEPAAGTGVTQCDTGEMVVWTDTDDSKCYFCYNHGGTVKSVELP